MMAAAIQHLFRSTYRVTKMLYQLFYLIYHSLFEKLQCVQYEPVLIRVVKTRLADFTACGGLINLTPDRQNISLLR